MGAQIRFTFEHDQVSRALAQMRLTPQRVAGIMGAIGTGMRRNTQGRFDTKLSPSGSRWQALNPAYAAAKTGPGILVEAGRRGGLQGSITFQVSGSTVTVGSNKVYAGVHQFGAVIRPKGKALVFKLGGRWVFAGQVRIPARPYLGFGKEDELVVLDALDVLLPGGR